MPMSFIPPGSFIDNFCGRDGDVLQALLNHPGSMEGYGSPIRRLPIRLSCGNAFTIDLLNPVPPPFCFNGIVAQIGSLLLTIFS